MEAFVRNLRLFLNALIAAQTQTPTPIIKANANGVSNTGRSAKLCRQMRSPVWVNMSAAAPICCISVPNTSPWLMTGFKIETCPARARYKSPWRSNHMTKGNNVIYRANHISPRPVGVGGPRALAQADATSPTPTPAQPQIAQRYKYKRSGQNSPRPAPPTARPLGVGRGAAGCPQRHCHTQDQGQGDGPKSHPTDRDMPKCARQNPRT